MIPKHVYDCLPESKSMVDVGELGRGESEWNPPEKLSSLTANWEPGSSRVRRDDDRPCFNRWIWELANWRSHRNLKQKKSETCLKHEIWTRRSKQKQGQRWKQNIGVSDVLNDSMHDLRIRFRNEYWIILNVLCLSHNTQRGHSLLQEKGRDEEKVPYLILERDRPKHACIQKTNNKTTKTSTRNKLTCLAPYLDQL